MDQRGESCWERVTLVLPNECAESAASLVHELTGRGVEFEEAGPKSTKVVAWFESSQEAELKQLLEFAGNCSLRLGAELQAARETVREDDWAESWKQYFKPVRAGRRFVIKPHWEPYSPSKSDIVIEIDPGQAFGVGTHASTALMLENLEWLFESMRWGDRVPKVLDVGTGTGILAIAAAKLGASRVRAIDIDPEAVRTARENAMRNGVPGLIEVDSEPLDRVRGDFDLVLANIDRDTLRLLGNDLARLCSPHGGVLAVSGILEEQQAETENIFKKHGMQPFRSITGSGAGDREGEAWASILFNRAA